MTATVLFALALTSARPPAYFECVGSERVSAEVLGPKPLAIKLHALKDTFIGTGMHEFENLRGRRAKWLGNMLRLYGTYGMGPQTFEAEIGLSGKNLPLHWRTMMRGRVVTSGFGSCGLHAKRGSA